MYTYTDIHIYIFLSSSHYNSDQTPEDPSSLAWNMQVGPEYIFIVGSKKALKDSLKVSESQWRGFPLTKMGNKEYDCSGLKHKPNIFKLVSS